MPRPVVRPVPVLFSVTAMTVGASVQAPKGFAAGGRGSQQRLAEGPEEEQAEEESSEEVRSSTTASERRVADSAWTGGGPAVQRGWGAGPPASSTAQRGPTLPPSAPTGGPPGHRGGAGD